MYVKHYWSCGITILFTNRSTDYGRTFVNETDKFPHDAVAHWYFISKDNTKVSCSIGQYTGNQ